MNRFACLAGVLLAFPIYCAAAPADITLNVPGLEEQVIQWRRHFHEYPELSNREFNTSAKIAAELKDMGLNVRTGIAHTGVVAMLEGAKPGPLVALRADMDALPVVEQVDLPFKSVQKGEYRGSEVGVMHACGHDMHMAILLGAARTLTAARAELAGSVMFIFQPAEESAPEGEEGGAELMLKEGIFDKTKPDAVFGLHVFATKVTNSVGYRAGPALAAQDKFTIKVKGRQTHGSRPWGGIDPIVVAAQIIMAAQTIQSRQVDVIKAPSILSFGIVQGGVRNNIIPDEVELVGTIRNFDMGTREVIHTRLRRTAKSIAESSGATAEVYIDEGYPVTVNDPALTEAMLPTLERVAGDALYEQALITGAEDFSYFAQQVPGLYLSLGVTPANINSADAAYNHSPLFFADESALITGVRLLANLTLDYFALNRGD